jgi:hypothetical protein
MRMKNNVEATSQAAAADPAASHDHAARWVAASLFALWAAISVVSAMAE